MPVQDDLYGTRRSRGIGGRLLVALILMLMLGGLGALAWTLVARSGGIDPLASSGSGTTNEGAAAAPARTEGTAPVATLPPATAAPVPSGTIDTRVMDLEQRIVRIQVAAEGASAYANRAEAIMVAFAARRALDAGAPLGYLEGQLRLLFNQAQPRAVATIINAAADPVTINKLRAGLDDIAGLIERGGTRESWWSSAWSTIGSLVELRSAGAPSPDADQRLARARRAVEAGQIEDAIKEVAALPGQPAIAQWLEQARRFNEAHRALDVIEQAAMLEPRTMAPPVLHAPASGAAAHAAPASAPKP